jgi:ubiquinone/menaquinone biosynthesis C-methylase UbiE
MTKQASNFIGSIPQHYDQFLGPRIFHDFADDLAGRVAELTPGSVLELAAGTGIVTRRLRDALPADCGLIASDLNPPMLEVAKSKFKSNEKVRFEPADAMSLPFDDSSFDAVACQFGIMFFPEKQRSYEEALRVLKPGGSYIFSVWGSWENNPFAKVAHETVVSFFPENPPGFYKVPFGYHDADEIRAAVSGAGFSRVTIQPLQLTSAIPSATEFATGLVFGNPLIEEITTRGGDPNQVCSAVAAAIGEQLGESMSLQALVINAYKDDQGTSI